METPGTITTPTAPVTAATQPPATASSPTAGSGLQATISDFGLAIVYGNMESAKSYLTPELEAQSATTPLAAMLGIQNTPSRYQYRILGVISPTTTITMTFTFAHGTVTDQLTCVETAGRWQISKITRM